MRNQIRYTIYPPTPRRRRTGGRRNTKQLIFILALCLLWLILPQGLCLGADYCVRSDATGNNDGSNWTNAWTDLSQARLPTGELGLERGATYYIADGSYGRYTFDDPEVGSEYITIKKAVSYGIDGCSGFGCHGTDDGWQASYGDEQAVFITPSAVDTPAWEFISNYWVVNGQLGGGPDDWDGSINSLGFKVTGPVDGKETSPNKCHLISIGDGWSPNNPGDYIELHHIEITPEGYLVDPAEADETNKYGSFGILAYINPNLRTPENGAKHLLVRNCYFHDNGMHLYITSMHNVTLEHNYFQRVWDDIPGDPHQEDGMKAYTPKNMTIRYNIWEDNAGSGTIWMSLGDQLGRSDDVDIENVRIYGNVFYTTPNSAYQRGNDVGTICVASDAREDDDVNGLYVYNNAFINLYGDNTTCGVRVDLDGDLNRVASITDFKVYNNIFYDVDQDLSKEYFFEGVTHRGYNWFYDCDMGYSYGTIHENEDEWFANGETNGQVGTADPFVDWQNMNFSLISATDAGLNLGVPYNYDMFNIERGADGVWDRGAIEYVESVFLYGDVSGDGQISAYDAVLAAMHAVGLIELTDEQARAADVTDNGTVSASDAAWIARRAVDGTIVFPVEQ